MAVDYQRFFIYKQLTVVYRFSTVKRRSFHAPNLMLITSNKEFKSFALGSAHEKSGV